MQRTRFYTLILLGLFFIQVGYAAEAISATKAVKLNNAATEETQQTGTVKWFDKQSGFGFIIPDAGGDEIFVHFSNIVPSEPNGHRSLSQGQRVAYTTTIVNNEQHLVSVTPLAQ